MDERFKNIEIRLAYLERSHGELDGVVRQLSDQVDVLVREVRRLRAAEHDSGDPALANEKPPHY